VISPGTVSGDERLRLFLGLRLPDEDVAGLVAWQERELRPRVAHGTGAAIRIVPRENLHVTLAFLGSRRSGELAAIVDALGVATAAARARGAIELEEERYRETRSVGMVVLSDAHRRATALADDLQARLEELGVYRREQRPWLPHLTVLRFRERPRLRPPLPGVGALVPSDAAVFLSRLHPSGARYEVLESFQLGG
jgi:RNA 2',3'-cyclic 3'-phosphodiesterase